MILKYYNNNKKLSNKPKYVSISKEFGTDNYLIQTFKRTLKFQNDKKLSEYENSLQELIQFISKTILFKKMPKIKVLSEENEEFLKHYKFLSKKFEAQTEQVLHDLIVKYTQRGYRIPKFSYKNNIFKINTLIEENSEKLRLMLMEELKTKQNIIGPKNINYLNKLFYILQILTSKDQNAIKKYTKLLNKKEPLPKKEAIEELKKEIENLINLTKDLKLNKIGYVKPKRKSSYLTNTPHLNNFKIIKSKNDSKDKLIKINTNMNANHIRNNNNTNNGITSTEESSGNMNIKERNPHNFLSMRLTNYGQQSSKLVSSFLSKNKISPFENLEHVNTENNNNKSIKNNNYSIKENPFINVKMKNFYIKQKSFNERLKTPSQRDKKVVSNTTNRKTYSDLTKYIAQAKKNKYYQSDKNNNYSLALKKTEPNMKRNDILSQKENSKISGNSFDNVKINYKLKRKSVKRNTLSRNANYQSELKQIKKVHTEKSGEKKSNFLWNAYRKIRKGNYADVEDYMRKYLKEIKEVNSKEENKIMEYYNYKNLRNNLFELNLKVNEESTRKKIEKMYSNIHILRRVAPSLAIMKEKENNIDRLEKIFTSEANK